MGKKSKRNTPEDIALEDIGDGQATLADDPQMERAITTSSKQHKKHKKSKEKDQVKDDHAAEQSVGVDEQKTETKESKKKRKAGESSGVQEDAKLSEAKKHKLNNRKETNEKMHQKPIEDCSLEVAEGVRNESCNNEQKKKKEKKIVLTEESAVSAALPAYSALNRSTSLSKKLTVEMDSSDCNTVNTPKSGKVCKKHKKEKKKSKHIDTTNKTEVLETDPQVATDSSSKKKKKGKSKEIKDNSLVDNSVGTTEEDSKVRKEKIKKHKHTTSELKVGAGENGLGEGSQENGADSSEPKAVGKNKKKIKLKAGEEEKRGDELSVSMESEENKCKKKKKKERSDDIHPVELCSVGEDSSENTRQKKKSKKKKKSQNVEESAIKPETDSGVNDQAAETKQKKKKRKSKDRDQSLQQQTAGGDASNGNVEEKQKDEQPLNPGETDSTRSSLPVTVGQWSTAMFKDSQRQDKFLRLLGGFKKADDSASGPKKGLFGSLQPNQDSTVGGHRALTYQAAQAMNRRLESDYERALSFSTKGQRGGGLGFTPDPAEGKKFHIDINRVTSTKFD